MLDCHYLELDGFNQHFQANVHFPLTRAFVSSAISNSLRKNLLPKKFRNPKVRTWAGWVWSGIPTAVLCQPPIVDPCFSKIGALLKGPQDRLIINLSGLMKRNITCYWGNRTCLNYTNAAEERNFCDDPTIAPLTFCADYDVSDKEGFLHEGRRFW